MNYVMRQGRQIAVVTLDPLAKLGDIGRPNKRKKWRRQYVQFPWAWIERLQAARRVSTYRLALLLVYESWRTGGQPIVLSNVLSTTAGLSRRTKWNALRELESLVLVKVERRRNKSPRVVLRL